MLVHNDVCHETIGLKYCGLFAAYPSGLKEHVIS